MKTTKRITFDDARYKCATASISAKFRVNYESRTQQQNIEVIILRNELKTILNQSFERLTILERTIMTDIVNGYKPHSIAQRFNIEHKVVYSRIQRAKRKIKRYLLLWWQ